MTETVEHRSFCRFCQALCGIVVGVEGDQVVRVRGDDEHPLSRGYVCPKGRALGAWHHHPDRIDHPSVSSTTTSWDACLDDLGGKLRRIIDESGPDAVGIFFGTGSSFDSAGGRGAFAFFHALGSRSRYTARTIDTPCRPLISDLMGGSPNLIPAIDFATTNMLVLVGSNPVVSHGHLASMSDPVRRLRELTADGREVWVLDPRRTETAQLATRHLQVRPGGDHAVLAYAIRELLGPDGGADHAFLAEHADGVERLEQAVAPFDLDTAVQLSGLDTVDLVDFVAAIRRHRRLAAVTGTGATMAASANVVEWLTRAIQVVTNSYEQPGGLWFNPGFIRCMDRRNVRPSGPDPAPVPGPPSRPELSGRYGEYPCAAMADEIDAGNLRALIVVGGNLAVSFPDHERTMAALGKLDVLACVDVVATETTAVATHVLPATGQLERADVPDYVDQYQSLVACQYTDAVVAPVAGRRPVWWIFAALGRAMGLDVLPPGLDLETATDADYIATLVARARLPLDELRDAPTAVVVDGPVRGWVTSSVLPDGRWRIAPEAIVAQLATLAIGEDELVLIPGRQLRTLNSALRDVQAPGGRRERPDVWLHAIDAGRADIADGDLVEVRSAHGACRGHARISDILRPGTVHIPHAWGDPNVARLTHAHHGVDPLTGMPRQSGIAVTVSSAAPAVSAP